MSDTRIDVVPDVNIWVGLFQDRPGAAGIIEALATGRVHSNVHILTVTQRVLEGLGAPEHRVKKFMDFITRLINDSDGSVDDTPIDYSSAGTLAYSAWRFSGTDLEDEAVVTFIKQLSARLGRTVTLLTMDRELLSYCEDRKVLAVNRRDFLLARQGA